ncbi:DUF1344 domain-containing protein [Oryzicola mucosus]|uniref:DUF1344 domain-containing protein n=1 Tax=Oryzicola mucosus TaxID=2767425 RepID=A0A8J6PMG3_9HYPH|nr:DUF1344 domain-containing protein [Oryzicola mucosus]MBD0416046.1 DUF1344 domain-containing protein [Oryzicola mucosus]
MRRIFGAVIAILAVSGIAFAAEAEGKIKSIDKDKMVITLNDGKAYKLPGEFDVDGLSTGMEILLAYDTVNGENMITDMQVFE